MRYVFLTWVPADQGSWLLLWRPVLHTLSTARFWKTSSLDSTNRHWTSALNYWPHIRFHGEYDNGWNAIGSKLLTLPIGALEPANHNVICHKLVGNSHVALPRLLWRAVLCRHDLFWSDHPAAVVWMVVPPSWSCLQAFVTHTPSPMPPGQPWIVTIHRGEGHQNSSQTKGAVAQHREGIGCHLGVYSGWENAMPHAASFGWPELIWTTVPPELTSIAVACKARELPPEASSASRYLNIYIWCSALIPPGLPRLNLFSLFMTGFHDHLAAIAPYDLPCCVPPNRISQSGGGVWQAGDVSGVSIVWIVEEA